MHYRSIGIIGRVCFSRNFAEKHTGSKSLFSLNCFVYGSNMKRSVLFFSDLGQEDDSYINFEVFIPDMLNVINPLGPYIVLLRLSFFSFL